MSKQEYAVIARNEMQAQGDVNLNNVLRFMVERQLYNCPERLQIVGSGDDQSAILTFLDGSVEQFDDDRAIAENVSRLIGELLGEELYQQFRNGSRDENLDDLLDVVKQACLPGFCEKTARFYTQRQFRNRIAESQEA